VAEDIAKGCTMCKALHGYFMTGYLKSSLYDARGEIRLHISYISYGPLDRFMVGIFPVDENGQSESGWLSYKLVPGSGKFTVYCPPFVAVHCRQPLMLTVEDPCVGVVPGTGIQSFTASGNHFRTVQGWMDECQLSHTKCRAQEPNFKPTRLLEISSKDNGDETTVRLVPGRESSGDYATLSYCWGKSNYTTTTDNLQRHIEDVPIATLPQTMQDAIMCTARLGLRYLWVDALCIVQDPESEMALEISLMSRIYRNANVTIAAALAADSDQGFLHDREFASAVPGETVPRLPFRCSTSAIGSVGLLKLTPTRFRDPVTTRGWTFQEQMLSPRLLIYGTLGVYWQCLESSSEPEDKDWMNSAGRLSRGWMVSVRQILHAHGTAGLLPNNTDTEDKWEKIVEEYSSRLLTYPHDKLPALSAIAAGFGAPHTRYVAGALTESTRQTPPVAITEASICV
jgi:hypothetical protein